MATKEHRRRARELIESLEFRVHAGPPVRFGEIDAARDYLRRNDFAAASDYFNRLTRIQDRVRSRTCQPLLPTKTNYGGEAAGHWLQVQSTYDHVILSTCYDGEFNGRTGRIKLSHRFNQAGRIEFVELKYLRPLEPSLRGELRKLVLVRDYASLQKDWHAAEAFVLPVLPRELVFLYADIFRCPRNEVLAWLINIGHEMAVVLLEALRVSKVNGFESPGLTNGSQVSLVGLRTDEVALPILSGAASLKSVVEPREPKLAEVRYLSR